MAAPVVLVFHSRVADGADEAFIAWHDRVEAAQSAYAGYVGTTVQPPIAGVQDEWVTMISFDTAEHLDAWLESDTRRSLADEAGDLFVGEERLRLNSGFDGWFGTGAADQPAPWKMNYVVLTGLYPLVMIEVLFLYPTIDWMGLALANLVGIIFSVGLLGWPIVAFLRRRMAWWLDPAPDAPAGNDLRGALVLVGILAAMVVFFSVLAAFVHLDPIREL